MKLAIQNNQTSGQLQELTQSLNYCHLLLEKNEEASVRRAARLLIDSLYALKSSSEPSIWQAALEIARRHPLVEILKESPQIQHSKPWPRGYLGDAEMLDLVYAMGDREEKMAKATPRGRWLEETFFSSWVQVSARLRLRRLGKIIDDACQKKERSRILSIAGGHLREGRLCQAIRQRQFRRFVAHDQDDKSLRVVRQEFGGYGLETVADSLGAIFKKRIEGQFDLIYAAGLYDYLPSLTAAQLTKAAFDMLAPGGRFIAANYTPETPCAGFMEAFLDWPLIYRTETEVDDFHSLIQEKEKAYARIFREEAVRDRHCLLYLEVKRY